MKQKRFNILFIPMLPTLYGRRYQLSKHLAQNNNVHLIIWDMPYPITTKNILFNLMHSWKSDRYKKDNIIIHKVRRFPFFMPIINRLLFQYQIRKIYKNYSFI